MLLPDLSKFKNLEDAAKEMAGNHQRWQNFMWFGSSRVNKPENIMLAYTQTFQTGILEEANHEVVANLLKPYYSEEDDPNFVADDYGASISGDRNAAQGFAVRVYDDNGEITEVFEKLYDLASYYNEEEPLDEAIFDKINRQRMLEYIQGNLPYLCEKHGKQYSDQLASDITDVLVTENDVCLDYLDEEHDLIPLLKEMATPAKKQRKKCSQNKR
jgi:hypothetical protein